MTYSYLMKDIIPIGVDIDADGVTTNYYRLPCPILWVFRLPHPDDENQYTRVENIVTKVAVELISVSAKNKPMALVAPLDENDEPDLTGVLSFEGVTTYEGVLVRLGFTPSLLTN